CLVPPSYTSHIIKSYPSTVSHRSWSRSSTFASASSAPGTPLPTGTPSSFAPTPPPSAPSLATPMLHRCAAVLLCGDRPRRPPKCREHRIRVTNTPNFLTDDVAGLAISVPRKTTQADRYVRAGLWKARGTT
uniref:Uncharacterized protein n=1 Tax=Aegilops tauschii subsp. strangulata TaxID=200361 RepID=A0A453PN16_AEGTS